MRALGVLISAFGNAGLSIFLSLNLNLYANNLLPCILNYVNLFSVDASKLI